MLEQLEAIQEDLQSTWFELLGQRYALQDWAKGRPTYHPAWIGVRRTTWACNRLNEAIADLAIAQRALKEDNRC